MSQYLKKKHYFSKAIAKVKGYTDKQGSLLALLLVVAIFAGVTTALCLMPFNLPPSLQSGADPVTIPVTTQDSLDSKPVELMVTVSGERNITGSSSGTVTRYECQAGGIVESGTSTIAVNGESMLNLYFSIPMWRDLKIGDTGDDVKALQQELNDLGEQVNISGKFDTYTYSLVQKVARKAGVVIQDNILPMSIIVWLPARAVGVNNCSITLGDHISSNATLFTAPSTITSAVITTTLKNALPGKRVLLVDNEKITVNDDNTISNADDLLRLSTTKTFQQSASGGGGSSSGNMASSTGGSSGSAKNVTITGGKLQLIEPTKVSVLLPRTIITDKNGASCVRSDGKLYKVNIIGSELGKSFAQFEAGVSLDSVDYAPQKDLQCE